jgi:hypothetical protein
MPPFYHDMALLSGRSVTLQKDLCAQKGNQIAAQQFEMMLQIAQEAQDEENLVQLAQRLS